MKPLPKSARDWPEDAVIAYHERLGLRLDSDREATVEEKRWAAEDVRRTWSDRVAEAELEEAMRAGVRVSEAAARFDVFTRGGHGPKPDSFYAARWRWSVAEVAKLRGAPDLPPRGRR